MKKEKKREGGFILFFTRRPSISIGLPHLRRPVAPTCVILKPRKLSDLDARRLHEIALVCLFEGNRRRVFIANALDGLRQVMSEI
jgi:hypothetical protein